MAFAPIRTIWQQFRPLSAIRLTLTILARRTLDRYARVSYAQAGEDRVLSALLGRPAGYRGFYVDVGANDPVHLSNTYSFYRDGWRGITVDALPEMVERHHRERPRDRAICALVSDEAREFAFTEFETSVVSSVDDAHVLAHAGKMSVRARRTVLARSLTSILEEEGAPARFDLLSIDVEGHDLNVLRSLDFVRFQPEVVIIEILGLQLGGQLSADPVIITLRDRGYELIGYAHFNAYFRRTQETASDLPSSLPTEPTSSHRSGA